MKKIATSFLFGVLLISASLSYAQDYDRQIDSIKRVVANTRKAIDNYDRQEEQYYQQAKRLSKQLDLVKEKHDKAIENKFGAKESLQDSLEDLQELMDEKYLAERKQQIIADLKKMSGEEFSKKYGYTDRHGHGFFYLFNFKRGEPRNDDIMEDIVRDEMLKGNSLKTLFEKYSGNSLMEQAVILQAYNRYTNPYHAYFSLRPGDINEMLKFYETVSAFAEDKMNWINQNLWDWSQKDLESGGYYSKSHSWIEDFFIEASKQPADSRIKKNIAYIQDSVIKRAISMWADNRPHRINSAVLPYLNFENLGPQHIQKEDIKKMLIEKGVKEDSHALSMFFK